MISALALCQLRHVTESEASTQRLMAACRLAVLHWDGVARGFVQSGVFSTLRHSRYSMLSLWLYDSRESCAGHHKRHFTRKYATIPYGHM